MRAKLLTVPCFLFLLDRKPNNLGREDLSEVAIRAKEYCYDYDKVKQIFFVSIYNGFYELTFVTNT